MGLLEGFLAGWGGLPPELAEAEFEEEVSVAGVGEELAVSGEDCPDGVDGAAGAVGSVAAEDGEVVVSPDAAGLGDDEGVVDGPSCCDC